MDKREAIKIFIKRYPALFNLDPFPNETFKKTKREFFTNTAKISPPKDSDIAGEILEALIISEKVKNEKDLDKIFSLPFFRDKMSNKSFYYEKLRIKEGHKEPILDISKLENSEYVEQVTQEIKKQVESEVISTKQNELSKLDEEIQKRKDELEDIDSILFRENVPMPEEEVKNEQPNSYRPWWDELGLRDDPFFPLEGLSNISSKLWEQVVCKTEIFVKYEQMIDVSPRELFKNTVIYGQFGSGKTTFFDYINPKLYNNKIYPIYVQLGGEFEVRELIFEFRRQLNSDLSRLYAVLTGLTSERLETLDDEVAIIELLKNLTRVGAKGFIVFIDDLHKGDLDKAMRFLSYLQVLTSQLIRRTSFVNIGFFIAGSLEWQKKIAHDDKYSGSFAREEFMPPLKIDTSLDALNKRFKAFAKNPDNPRPFNRKFLEKIYARLQLEHLDITFRRVIRETVKEFEMGHLDPLAIDPVKIPLPVLEEIKINFESNLTIKRRFNRLIYSKTLKPWQKRRCLELFLETYSRNKLPEAEIIKADIPFLRELARTGLIISLSDNGNPIWQISQDIWYLNKQIIQRYNLSFEDYLLKIYGGDLPEEKRKAKSVTLEIQVLDGIISSMKEGILHDLLTDVREIHSVLLETEEEKEYLANAANVATVLDTCAKSLALLTRSYQIFEKLPIATGASDLESLRFWKDFWHSPETIQQFIRASSLESDDTKRLVAHVVSLYREAFTAIFCFFKTEYEDSRLFSIPLLNLKNSEIALLHECRNLWRDTEYEILAEKLTKVLERKIRTFLWDIFTILYGSLDNRLVWVDQDSRKYIQKNIRTDRDSGYTISRNEFQQLNRAQYKNLMTGINGSPEGRHNWNNIFHNVFTHWSEKELDDFLNIFADFNTHVSHDKGSIDRQVQDYVYSFLQKSTRFMIDVNRSYLKLLSSENFRHSSQSSGSFSLNNFKDQETLSTVNITKEDADKIDEAVEGKSALKLLLDDQEYLEGIFGLNYQKSYSLLAICVNQTDEQTKKTKLKFSINTFKGPEIVLQVEALD